MSDAAQDAQYLRENNIPALVNDMIVQILKSRPADPVGCLSDWMASPQCDRGKYGPGKGEAGEAAEEKKEEEEEDDPAEGLEDLAEVEGDLNGRIKAVLAEGKTRIALNKNRLKEIPPSIPESKQITSLSVEENQLDPEAIKSLMQMPQLEYLNISDNPGLKVLPEGFGDALKNLKKIDAYKCSFSGPLSSEVVKMESLTYLNVYNNSILKVPPEITQLTNLTELNLASNKIMAIQPGQLDNFKKLKRLALFWNRLLRIPPLTPLVKLNELQLYDNQLPEMPELGSHPDLTSVNLSANKMTTLHESLFNQPALEEFLAGKNQLTNETILTGWPKLTNMRKIALPSNLIKEFPSIFLDLPALKVLELTSNQIEVLPEDIDRFEKKAEPLNHLFLAENKFTTLPKAMMNCKSFMRLGFNKCPLSQTDPTTKEVYTFLHELIQSKGVDGKWLDGKRTWKQATSSGPSALGIGGGGQDPEMKKKKGRAEDAGSAGGVTLSVG